MKKNILLLATFALLATGAHAADEFVADELLVAFQPGARGARADGLRNGLGAAKIKGWTEINAEHWHLPRGLGVAQAIQALSANPNVSYAEPNYIIHADDAPDDPMRANLWGFHNIAQTGGTPDADIDALEAWDVRTDAGSVVVGVADSGIDYNHPDLAANIWTNPSETGLDAQGRDKASNGLDDDGNGYVDDWHGWNFVNNTNDPFDDDSHGTHVAGTIGAVGNNGIGVAGVAWSVKLMPLKHLNSSGSGAISAATEAILYAAKFVDASGEKIVQITSHSYGSGSKSKTLENAIKSCGALVVASAGNSATSTPQYPAAYVQPNVIAVAATDRNDALAAFSNFGSWVPLAAPGVDILSTTPNGTYDDKSGTSMAAPHVSGVAALVLAQNPSWSSTDLKAQLLNTVDALPALAGKVTTGGRLNARKALGASEFAPDTTAPAPVTDLAGISATLTSITVSWTAPGDDDNSGACYFYDLRYSTVPVTEQNFSYATPLSFAPQTAGGTETFTVTGSYGLYANTTYYFAVKAYDEAGNASPISNVAAATTVDNGWRFMVLNSGHETMANTVSLALNAQAQWSIAHDRDGNLTHSDYPGGGFYTINTIGPISSGASLAFNSAWEPGITYVYAGKLNFARKSGGAWTITQIENRDVYNGSDTSLLYDSSGTAFISYHKTGRSSLGFWSARRTGTSWTLQQIEKNADAIYNQLALALDGRPTAVYTDDSNGDGSLDTLKLAHYTGTAWSVSVIDSVASGPVSLAYNPVTGSPVVACRAGANNELRFYTSTGTAWVWEARIRPQLSRPVRSPAPRTALSGSRTSPPRTCAPRFAIRQPEPGAPWSWMTPAPACAEIHSSSVPPVAQ